jgi:hypothetical protein
MKSGPLVQVAHELLATRGRLRQQQLDLIQRALELLGLRLVDQHAEVGPRGRQLDPVAVQDAARAAAG